MSKENMQVEFDRLVNRGIILGCAWIMGIGSVIALISAFQARKLMKNSGYTLEGKNKIIKCLVIGISGFVLWMIALLIILIFKK